jgi:hypothetical protein
MDAVENAVIDNYTDNVLPDSHGLAIYFPETEASFDSDYNGTVIDFPNETDWDEFLQWYYSSGGDQISLIEPVDGAILSAAYPATFSWAAGSGYRYKVEFSPTTEFVDGFPTLSVPRNFLAPETTTDNIPEPVWNWAWNIIKLIEGHTGIVYWRVIGRDVPPSPLEASEVRSFKIE